MLKKIPVLLLLIFLGQFAKAQNEFITIWKPTTAANMDELVAAPHPVEANQIWFPGVGQNYTINWEEVGYPQHNGTMPNVTSTTQVLIDFGAALNPVPDDVKYRVKVSNGNGSFNQIRFGLIYPNTVLDAVAVFQNLGSIERILEVEQWGNIQWTSMYSAFTNCMNLKITATDTPNFNSVTDASYMFYKIPALTVSTSIANWNVSTIKNFKGMFGGSGISSNDTFNPPISNWNISSAENLSQMFGGRQVFNQNLNGWNTSNVTNMSYLFHGTKAFNQPLDNWNTSMVTNMSSMFNNAVFNQSINSWNVSNVTDISNMFHDADHFNKPLSSWNTSNIENMNGTFAGADSFNQNLGNWDLSSLTSASLALSGTSMNCVNYSYTLAGWAQNPNTPNNISISPLIMFTYSPDVVVDRNTLISKGWTIFGDTLGTCEIKERLATSETSNPKISIYPNPAHDIIYLKNISNAKSFVITDLSGRIVMKDLINKDLINIQDLTSGTYILELITKDKIQSLKFIKK
ncbi:BspA family leucine-rich repeat surface protein [Chryseobacterium sp. LC2016-27]|jgi:surface protein|uniref:BspA family leucine-rich repeat surface protein n=1 Tax=Chryseobacterium sp. LC2016-27 TaxID=2897326 RepID=UPI001E53BFA8|nr:BspA family leucine-rich repeat surface protein [Chryseobacterium sp. LC2016-27]MCD0455440.1 BspA family leucine-rich repeat surface protein [Chryseobacterium sp. LC2016-27]